MNAREALKAWRTDAKLTQPAAAELLGCGEDMLGAIERAARYPGRELANQIKAHAGIATEAWDELQREDEAHGASVRDVDEKTVTRGRARSEARRT